MHDKHNTTPERMPPQCKMLTLPKRGISGTCDGPGVIHPGKQNIPNAQAWLAQGVEDEEEEATPIETDANSAEVTEILKCHLNCSTNCYTTMQDKENCAFSPSLVIPLNNKNGDGIYRVRTLIDSGFGSSWIAKDVLPKIKYKLIGHKQLRVRTFGQEIEKRFKIVQIYFENHNTKYAVRCYVIENFLKHILVKGLKDYLCKNTQLSPQVISRVVDPTESEIDHKDINEGTGLVLSNEDACLITKETNSRLCLKDKRLILDDTYFGIAVSGKVPNCLLRDTNIVQANWAIPRIINLDEPQNLWMYQADIQEVEVETIDGCEACSQRCVLEDQLKILEDKEHLGISKSEWQHLDDVSALEHYKKNMKRLPNGQFEVRLPTNEMIDELKPNERQAKAKAYKEHAKCLQNKEYGIGSTNEMLKLRA